MKRLLPALAFAALLCLVGCAAEGPTGEELQEQVGRGLRGEGQLSSGIDRTGDPYVQPRGGAPGRPE